MDLEWLAVGKKLGLSFEEINILRVRDLAAFADIMLGIEKKQNKIRYATQEDIDRLLA